MLSLFVICAPAWRIFSRARGISILLELDTPSAKDVHVIAVLEKLQGELQHTDMILRRLIGDLD